MLNFLCRSASQSGGSAVEGYVPPLVVVIDNLSDSDGVIIHTVRDTSLRYASLHRGVYLLLIFAAQFIPTDLILIDLGVIIVLI